MAGQLLMILPSVTWRYSITLIGVLRREIRIHVISAQAVGERRITESCGPRDWVGSQRRSGLYDGKKSERLQEPKVPHK
jgi:hypothetical protein